MKSNEDKLKLKLVGRLKDLGYKDITDFWRQTKIGMSHETVRRALHGGKPVSAESFIKIAANLNFSPREIAKMVGEYLGDAFWPKMISGGELSDGDRVLLKIISKVFTDQPELWSQFVAQIALFARAAGVDITRELDQIVRPHDLQDCEVSKLPAQTAR